MAEPDRQQLLTALTTEHFGLAGTRAQATGESSARASAVSSTLVAGVGGVVAIISLVRLLRIENRMYHEMGGFSEALFPSPEA